MTNLSDTQRVLLSTAARRDHGSLLPLPASLKPGGGTNKAIAALLKHGLAEERQTLDAAASRRVDADVHYGVFITAAGALAIGVEPERAEEQGGAAPAIAAPPATNGACASRKPSKAETVLALLARPDGASLPELIAATGWLPHTTRAALTGLRKKGHEITRGKRDGVTCYRIAGAA